MRKLLVGLLVAVFALPIMLAGCKSAKKEDADLEGVDQSNPPWKATMPKGTKGGT